MNAPEAEQPDRAAFEGALLSRLLSAGALDELAAERALRLQAGTPDTVENILIRLGLVHERDVAQAIADELGLKLAQATDFPDTPCPGGSEPEISPSGTRAAARRGTGMPRPGDGGSA